MSGGVPKEAIEVAYELDLGLSREGAEIVLEKVAPLIRSDERSKVVGGFREALAQPIHRLRQVTPNEVHRASVHLRGQVATELEEILAALNQEAPDA